MGINTRKKKSTKFIQYMLFSAHVLFPGHARKIAIESGQNQIAKLNKEYLLSRQREELYDDDNDDDDDGVGDSDGDHGFSQPLRPSIHTDHFKHCDPRHPKTPCILGPFVVAPLMGAARFHQCKGCFLCFKAAEFVSSAPPIAPSDNNRGRCIPIIHVE
ncbi:uncharacterized protein BO72DRAFT_163415 [Aspergillus fijiensis CBS 313.89]|uniref:Uncharacterized protein n=1 Tax=Aspergillus fijiensis CBS 313.89 TaxID=1448319 RepID=A0A8G1VWI9_9EURO|nr:uncharacterized protein BO72DRAFT_163415 [Aspergillus fijiensis CBS 313.89]RAK75630.1 hypothetical protein BO72DRAFT_163415 [Aspergillus fijiensis CBS 313.89]